MHNEDMLMYLVAGDASVEDETEKSTKQQSGPPKFWDEFLAAKYEGGKKKVSNPNPDTRSKFPEVALTTAIKDEGFRQRVMKEYADWLKKRPSDKPEGEKSVKEDVADKSTSSAKHPMGITEKDISETAKKYAKEFDALLGDPKKLDVTIKQYEEHYTDTHLCTSTAAQWAKTEFSKLSKEEKILHLVGYKFGQMFESKVLSPKSKDIHKGHLEAWRGSSGCGPSQELHGLASKLGYSGSCTPTEKGRPNVKFDRKKGAQSEELKQYFKEAYTYTQAVFKHLGVKELTLFRGVSGQGLDKDPPNKGSEVEVQTREMSSYTLDPKVSNNFGRTLEFKVPVDRVFASAITRPDIGSDTNRGDDDDDGSSWGESEMIIMGASDFKGRLIQGIGTNRYASSKKPFKVQLDDDNEDWLAHGNKKKKEVAKNTKKDKKNRGKSASNAAMAFRVVARFSAIS